MYIIAGHSGMTRRIEGADFLKVTQECCQNDKILAQALRPSLDSPSAGKDESRRSGLSETFPESSFRPILSPNRILASKMSLVGDRYQFAPNIDGQKKATASRQRYTPRMREAPSTVAFLTCGIASR
jgi:hypothetical protein